MCLKICGVRELISSSTYTSIQVSICLIPSVLLTSLLIYPVHKDVHCANLC